MASARSLKAAAMRLASSPGFQRKVSKCTEFSAARMRSISTSKKAPFSSTSTVLPSTEVLSVRPDSEGISLSMPDSDSTRSTGLRWRRIDQITRTRTAIRAKESQTHREENMEGGRQARLFCARIVGAPPAARGCP
jgi:hypothetical protein